MTVGIINYGMGNLRSVQKAFERLNVESKIVSSPSELRNCSRIVLPGVGHFLQGIQNLRTLGFDDAVKELVTIKQIPILGICLGMQLLTNYSEEGHSNGLAMVDGTVARFVTSGAKIPHMGWNSLNLVKKSSVFPELDSGEVVYFVHSYYVTCNNRNDSLYKTEYEIVFDSAFEHDNIVGFQFHPEKSHKVGLKLLSSFLKL